MPIEVMLYIVMLLTALPAGYLLAWLCKDELLPDKKWLILFVYCLAFFLVLFLLIWRNLSIILGLVYMMIAFLFTIYLGKSRKFMKR